MAEKTPSPPEPGEPQGPEKVPAPDARGAMAEKPAADIAKPGEEIPEEGREGGGDIVQQALDAAEQDKLPDNKYSRLLKAIDQEAARSGISGPLINGAKAICALLAMWGHLGDLVPGSFLGRLDKDNLEHIKPTKDELEAMLAARKKRAEELAQVADGDKEQYKQDGAAKASTKHACKALWGLSGIEDPEILAAKLKHAQKDSVPYYRTATLGEMTAQGMPFGTVLIFAPNIIEREKVVAYATGNGDEFQYYDAESGAVKTFKLSQTEKDGGEACPISDFNLMAAFVPRFNSDPEWFRQNPDSLDNGIDETPEGQANEAKSATARLDNFLKPFDPEKLDLQTAEQLTASLKYGLARCQKAVTPIFEKFKDKVDSKEVAAILKDASGAYESAIQKIVKLLERHLELLGKEESEQIAKVEPKGPGESGKAASERIAKAKTTIKQKIGEQKNPVNALLTEARDENLPVATKYKDHYAVRFEQLSKTA